MNGFLKRLILDVGILIMTIVAVGLVVLMHKYMGKIEYEYIPNEEVYATSFNIGFRWSTILGMVGVVLIRFVMTTISHCNKNYRLLIWSTEILIFATIAFEEVIGHSESYLYFVLRDDWQYSNPGLVDTIGDYVDFVKIFSLVVIGVYFFIKWIVGIERKEKSNFKKSILMTLPFSLLSVLILVFETFSNPWYLITCAITSVAYWIALSVIGNKWQAYLNNELPNSTVKILFEKMINIF